MVILAAESASKRSARGRSRMTASSRRTTPCGIERSTVGREPAPLWRMPAVLRCSCSSRAYGLGLAVEDADPVRWDGLEVGEQLADDAADLVVGVGGVEDPRSGGLGVFGKLGDVGQPIEGGQRRPVGPRQAGATGDHREVRQLPQHRDEVLLRDGEVLGEIQDDRAELGAGPRVVDEVVGGPPQEILLVVEPVLDPALHAAVETHDVRRQPGTGGDLRELSLVQSSQLAVDAEQGGHRRLVLTDLSEHAGIIGQGAAPGGGQDRSGRGPPRTEEWGGQAFGQAIDRAEEETRDACLARCDARGQVASHHDAGRLVRHQHGDGRQRVVGLDLGHQGGELIEGRPAVPGGDDARCHRTILSIVNLSGKARSQAATMPGTSNTRCEGH